MSIINFEKITEDLTEVELSYTNTIKNILLGILDDKKPAKQPDLCESINAFLEMTEGNPEIKVNGVLLRKFVNYFRSNGILPLVATSEGYLLTWNKEQIEQQIKSLEQRANSIMKAANGLKKYI